MNKMQEKMMISSCISDQLLTANQRTQLSKNGGDLFQCFADGDRYSTPKGYKEPQWETIYNLLSSASTNELFPFCVSKLTDQEFNLFYRANDLQIFFMKWETKNSQMPIFCSFEEFCEWLIRGEELIQSEIVRLAKEWAS